MQYARVLDFYAIQQLSSLLLRGQQNARGKSFLKLLILFYHCKMMYIIRYRNYCHPTVQSIRLIVFNPNRIVGRRQRNTNLRPVTTCEYDTLVSAVIIFPSQRIDSSIQQSRCVTFSQMFNLRLTVYKNVLEKTLALIKQLMLWLCINPLLLSPQHDLWCTGYITSLRIVEKLPGRRWVEYLS